MKILGPKNLSARNFGKSKISKFDIYADLTRFSFQFRKET